MNTAGRALLRPGSGRLGVEPGAGGAEVAHRRLADPALAAPGLVDVAADREPGSLLLDPAEQGLAAEVVAAAVGVAVSPGGRVEDEDRVLGAVAEHRRRRAVVEVEAPVPRGDRDPGPEAEELRALDRRAFAVQDGRRLPG